MTHGRNEVCPTDNALKSLTAEANGTRRVSRSQTTCGASTTPESAMMGKAIELLPMRPVTPQFCEPRPSPAMIDTMAASWILSSSAGCVSFPGMALERS
jgi:hypothetical protein